MNKLLGSDLDNDKILDFTGVATTNEIINVNSYYSFGMVMQNGNFANNTTTPDTKYQYNNKEFNGDLPVLTKCMEGLNLLDYSLSLWTKSVGRARWYDPAIGRFTSVGPMTETQEFWSSYHFNYGNPVNYIDYFGLEPESNQSFNNISVCPTCPDDSKFDPERESKDTYVYEPESGATYLEGIMATITANSSNGPSLYSYYSPIISAAGKGGDYIDPWIGTSALHISKQLNKALEYHSFTTGVGFEKSLNTIPNQVKTFFGPIKAARAMKFAKALGKVGIGLNIVSGLSYLNDFSNGQKTKALTGFGVMFATTAAAIICPPCALGAIAVSAGYSLFLEDQIFEPVKE